jgi:hypothetical protein
MYGPMTIRVWQLAAVAAVAALGGAWMMTRSASQQTPPAATVSAQVQQSQVAPEQALTAAEANVSAAVPALAAWFADNGSYAGVTAEALQQYAAGARAIDIPYASATGYCVESVLGTVAAHARGPGGNMEAGRC